MSDYERGKLKDHVHFYNGRIYPKTVGDIPIYGGNGILGYTDQSHYSNCIIIGRVGAKCGCVYMSSQECWVSDNAIAIQCDETCDLSFIYYQLSSLKLNQRQIGSGQPLLTQGILSNIPIVYPPIKEQCAISSVLTAIDEKISINERLNHNLAPRLAA